MDPHRLNLTSSRPPAHPDHGLALLAPLEVIDPPTVPRRAGPPSPAAPELLIPLPRKGGRHG